jgi:hypothetical protein
VNYDDRIIEQIDLGAKRREIAEIYEVALREGIAVNWERINEAIIARWSLSGLKWIKERAWRA